MDKIIDYFKNNFTLSQTNFTVAMLITLTLALILCTFLAIFKPIKRINRKKEEKERIQLERQKKNDEIYSSIASLDGEITKIEAEIVDSRNKATDKIETLKKNDETINANFKTLNEEDKKKISALNEKKETLEKLYKKQTTGLFKSNKKSAQTQAILKEVTNEKIALNNAIMRRDQDKNIRANMLQSNIKTINSDLEVKMFELKARKSYYEAKKAKLEAQLTDTKSGKKMSEREARDYVNKRIKEKNDAQAEAEKKAREELQKAKDDYEAERKRRIEVEKEIELALENIRDSEKQKKKLQKESAKKNKLKYVPPTISTDTEPNELEPEIVNTIVADISASEDSENNAQLSTNSHIGSKSNLDNKDNSPAPLENTSLSSQNSNTSNEQVPITINVVDDDLADNSDDNDDDNSINIVVADGTDYDGETMVEQMSKLSGEELNEVVNQLFEDMPKDDIGNNISSNDNNLKPYSPPYAGVPTIPIRKDSKFQKPTTRVVLKDTSEHKNDDFYSTNGKDNTATNKPTTKDNKVKKEEKKQQDTDGKWVICQDNSIYIAKLIDLDGNELLCSPEYTSLSGTKSSIHTIKNNLLSDNVAISIEDGKFKFKIFSSSNRILCVSVEYKTKFLCEKALNKAKEIIGFAEITIQK